ncbi:6-phosphofructokinase [Ruminococcaceae bacterium OttesenSCG-928-N02]|nr:6-phosphofructokinase [Ruminococcaceae bacterium OttesenSCG-928-N02]
MFIMIKTIGVLTSGGDAPGMNAAIRAVTRTAIYNDMNVLGVRRGFNGLINGDIFEMQLRTVSDIIHRGGTILYSTRSREFTTPEGQLDAIDTCKKFGIDALVIIGGDGSFKGGEALARQGIPCVGVPATIDNDIACSEYTIGYDTAMNTAMEMIDKLRDTTQAHQRCSVVEVMGRHSGYIAVNTGIAVGALACLVPEVPFELERDVISRMFQTERTGKQHFIILVAEGVGQATEIAATIQKRTGIDARATILGHVQRGGSPSLRDRELASRMGYHAVNLLQKGMVNRVVCMANDAITDVDMTQALLMRKSLSPEILEVARVISI